MWDSSSFRVEVDGGWVERFGCAKVWEGDCRSCKKEPGTRENMERYTYVEDSILYEWADRVPIDTRQHRWKKLLVLWSHNVIGSCIGFFSQAMADASNMIIHGNGALHLGALPTHVCPPTQHYLLLYSTSLTTQEWRGRACQWQLRPSRLPPSFPPDSNFLRRGFPGAVLASPTPVSSSLKSTYTPGTNCASAQAPELSKRHRDLSHNRLFYLEIEQTRLIALV